MSAARRLVRTVIALGSAAVLALAGSGTAVAGGDTDTTFGSGGWIDVAVGGSADVGGIVRRDDGSLVVGDSVNASVMTVALTSGGDLLDTYGSGGISSTPVPGSSSVTVTDVAIQANGRVVLAGWESATSGSDRMVVARFRAGGSPDDSFSGDGVAKIGFSQGDAYGYGLTVMPDGTIVVVGEVDPTSGVSNSAIARLMPDGSLDTSFGDHGRVMVRIQDGIQGYDAPWRVVPQAHGAVAMAGWQERSGGNYKTMAMRLRADGSLDPTFSSDGVAIVDVDHADNWAYGLAADGDKLVLGTHTSVSDAGFVRLNANGSRDTTFGGDGIAVHTLSVSWEVEGVVVGPDHRVIAVNGFLSGPNIVVLKARGGLDTGYSSDGEGLGPFKGAYGDALLQMGNGKVVVAGTSGSDVIAVRFQPV